MVKISENMRKAITNMLYKPISQKEVEKEEALVKLQTISGQDVSEYRLINTERINLMTNIIACSGFNLDDAMRLSWYGPWILGEIRDKQSKDATNSIKALAQTYGAKRDHAIV